MQVMVQASVIAASLFLAACGGAAAPGRDQAPASVPEMPVAATPVSERGDEITSGLRIVMLGDSLTAGYGLAPQDALPEQIATRLEAAGLALRMVNAGVSGDTSANGLARYDWSVASAQPDVIIIALGANDYLLGLSADTTRANLAAIIERAQADGAAVILLGLEPRSNAPAGSRDAAYAAIYPELAATYSVPLYPAMLAGVRDNSALLQADGLHPTAEGIGYIADQLLNFLRPHLQVLDGQ